MDGPLTQCCSARSLLKFRDEKESAKATYDEYRDAAGKMVLANGGNMAFLGQIKASCCSPHRWLRAISP